MMCRFVWDEAKYPTVSPLREIVDGIHVQVAKIEDDLKACSFVLRWFTGSNFVDMNMNFMNSAKSLAFPYQFVKILDDCDNVLEFSNI